MNGFKGKTLLLLGDSIMYGAGNGGYGVGEYLVKDLGVKLKKYCVGGARVGFCEGKNWLVEQVRSAVNDGVVPDYVVFDGFTNDCFRTDGVNFDVPLGNTVSVAPDVFAVEKTDDFSICFESIVAAFEKYFPAAKALFVRPHKMGRREEEAQKIYVASTKSRLRTSTVKADWIRLGKITAISIPRTLTAGAKATVPIPTVTATKNFTYL